MNPANRHRIGERELEELNAQAEASLTFDDQAWDDAVRDAEDDCALLCEALLSDTGRDRE